MLDGKLLWSGRGLGQNHGVSRSCAKACFVRASTIAVFEVLEEDAMVSRTSSRRLEEAWRFSHDIRPDGTAEYIDFDELGSTNKR